MRKFLLLSFLLATFLLNSCKKSEEKASTNSNTSQPVLANEAVSAETVSMIQSIKSLPDQDQKRAAIDLLKASDKYFLWKDNIKTTSANFNTAQLALITELTGYLSPQLFNTAPTGDMTTFRDQWLAKAQKIFTTAQIRAIAFQLYPTTDHLVINDSKLKTNQFDDGGGDASACNCNIGSIFSCNDNAYCPRSDDVQFGCSLTSSRCGFLWAFPCNNNCMTLGSNNL